MALSFQKTEQNALHRRVCAIGLRCAGHTGITPADVVRVNLKVLPQDNVGFEIIQRTLREWQNTAPAPAETGAFANQTLRMNARVSIGGGTLRVRVSNAYGNRKLLLGAAHIGRRDTGSGVVAG